MTEQEKLEEIKARISDTWKHIDCPEEWNPLIIECHEKLMEIDPNYMVLQIKEKFGGLRYYFDTLTDNRKEMQDVVNVYEKASFEIPHRH